MTFLHVFELAWGAVQIIGWLAVPFAIVAGFVGKPDPRFEGARLWYRS